MVAAKFVALAINTCKGKGVIQSLLGRQEAAFKATQLVQSDQQS